MSQGFVWTRDQRLIEQLARDLEAPLSAAASRALGQYLELVSGWNRKLDLTAARDAESMVEVLLADSFVLASRGLVPPGSTLVDVGSGSGSPALPLLLLRSDLSGTLVEPLRKRVAFLRTALGTLDLVSRACVLEQKLDLEAPEVAGGPFDLALSRATFSPQAWLPLGAQLAMCTLVLLAAQAPPTAAGVRLERVVEYALPRSKAERRIASYLRAY